MTRMPIRRWWLGPIPLPSGLAPLSRARESLDDLGERLGAGRRVAARHDKLASGVLAATLIAASITDRCN